jgi:hypothetical protein
MRGIVAVCLWALCAALAAGQEPPERAGGTPGKVSDAVSLIGLTLGEVFSRFGPPGAVYSLRGEAAWQDDVVFEYADADLFFFKDRVWQTRLKAANGIKVGDARVAITLVFGNAAEDRGSHFIVTVPNRSWPLEYRYTLDAHGRVASIYLYRPDY